MARRDAIILAALGGAVVGATVAYFLKTERGQRLLNSASESLKDIGGKATKYAKTNFDDVIEKTRVIGDVVKGKLSRKFS